jgi:hypothetical protein
MYPTVQFRILFLQLFSSALSIRRSRDSSVVTALGYGLDDRGVRVPVGAGNFSLNHRFQTDSGAPRSLLSNGYQGIFLWGGKAAGA